MSSAWAAIVATPVLHACASLPQQQSAPLQVAITVDDLPIHGEIPPGETPLQAAQGVIAALQAHGVNAYGFANAQWTERQPASMEVLTAWRAAGLPLANHGWSHRHLNEMTPEEFEREVARNEPVLKRLSKSDEWRWFRYPFLDEGETPEKRAAARAVLARRGYQVAAVTMDFSDWQWTAPYARCAAAGDRAAIARMENSFLKAADEAIDYYRSLSRSLYGRDISYVLLLHVSAFEGRMLLRLLDLYEKRGFRFVSLEEAQRDTAYREEADPNAPAPPQGLERKAAARGITLPRRTDFAPMLEALCKSNATAP